jgi:predicted transposase YdaD
MPILDDIMDHDVIGPAIREGLQQGRREGLQQGLQQGELIILRRLLGKRFGALPTWVDERLTKLSSAELEELSLRLFDVKSIDELFSR